MTWKRLARDLCSGFRSVAGHGGRRGRGAGRTRCDRRSVEQLEARTLLALYVGPAVPFPAGHPTFFETTGPSGQAATTIRGQFDYQFDQTSRLFDGSTGPVFNEDVVETFVLGPEPVENDRFASDLRMPFSAPRLPTVTFPDIATAPLESLDDSAVSVDVHLPLFDVGGELRERDLVELRATFVEGRPDLRVRPSANPANVVGNDVYEEEATKDQVVRVNVKHGGTVSLDIQLQEDDPLRQQALFFSSISTSYRIAVLESAETGWTVGLPGGLRTGNAGLSFAVAKTGPTNLRVTIAPDADVPLGTTKELTFEVFDDASVFGGLSEQRQLELRQPVRDSIRVIATVVTEEDAADDQPFGGHFVVNHDGRSATNPHEFFGDPLPGDGIVDAHFNPFAIPPVPPSGIVTLLGVLQEIRRAPGQHRITFSVPQVFVHQTLFLLDSVDIDGRGINGLPGVEVTFVKSFNEPRFEGDPPTPRPIPDGFHVEGTGVTIEGLIINNRVEPGEAAGRLLFVVGNGAVIRNNFIGTERTGQDVQGATALAVEIIGSDTQFLGNVVATNPGVVDSLGESAAIGILVKQLAIIRGNRIGLEGLGASGSIVPNGEHGVLLEEQDFTEVLPFLLGGLEESDGNIVQGFDNGVTVQRNDVTVQGNELRGNVTGAFLGRGTNLIGNTIVANEVGVIDQAFGNVIRGNRIGVEADGGLAGNRVAGLHVSGSSFTQVGGANPSDANIIGGNEGPGILITVNPSDGSPLNLTIQGNFIGTDASGRDLGNQGHGVFVRSKGPRGSGGTIGGQNPGQGNVIRFNDGAGIAVANGTTGRFKLPLAAIQDNFSLQVNLGTMVGIEFASEAAFVTELQNRLASFPEVFAAHLDRLVQASAQPSSTPFNAVGNSISDNGGLGIDIFNVLTGDTPDGITPNDGSAEFDRIQNFPVITAATFDPVAGTTTLSGSLTTLSNATGSIRYRLDFYDGGEVGPAGELEGKHYLGSTEIIQTSATMPFTFTINDPVGGEFTATATKIAGITPIFGTSEFSPAPPGLVVNDARDLPDLNVNDNVIDVDPAAGEQRTLRAVLQFANREANRDRITFDIPGGGVPRITLNSPLPVIVNPVQIDATTQPNAARVELRGRNTNANEHGLQIAAGKSLVRGLVIGGFGGHGIVDTSLGGNEFDQLILGADASLSAVVPNGLDGIHINGSPNNVISDSTIVGNRRHGVQITGSTATNNQLFDNRIGTLFPNSGNGVTITNAPSNRIGLVGQGPNTIGGNLGHGLLITGASASGNLVFNNHIGVEKHPGNLTAPLGNFLDGIRIENAPNNFIGDTGNEQFNVISTNLGNGIAIVGAQASNNRVFQNFIGTTLDGQFAIGNTLNGVLIDNAPNNLVGIFLPNGGNVITGHGEFGVQIKGPSATNNKVFQNIIGPNDALERVTSTLPGVAGSFAGNRRGGILIQDAPNNLVGDSFDPDAPNLVAANIIQHNTGPGLHLLGSRATGNTILGNEIVSNDSHGLLIESAGNNVIGGQSTPDRLRDNQIAGNAGDGIHVKGAARNSISGNLIGLLRGRLTSAITVLPNQNGILLSNASFTTIGGALAGEGNVISGNQLVGVRIEGTGSFENTVSGNLIGTNPDGDAALPNGAEGVAIFNASFNTIGGTAAEAGNVISGNRQSGVRIQGPDAFGNKVFGNLIGANRSANAAIPNEQSGVNLINAFDTDIGGTTNNPLNNPRHTPGRGNVISGNGQNGIAINGADAQQIRVLANLIGTNAGGDPLPNGVHGIHIANNASSITIGSNLPDTGNAIRFNNGAGVAVESASRVAIRGNGIVANSELGIDLANNGVTANDSSPNGHDADPGPNDLQNFPVLAEAGVGGNVEIRGSLASLPGGVFALDFYAIDPRFAGEPDPEGHGEGARFLGSLNVTTDANGATAFLFIAPNQHFLEPGDRITATATDRDGNTSEFSQNLELGPPLPPPLGDPNSSPRANDDDASAAQNTPVEIDVLENDRDPNGDTITIQRFTQPATSAGVVTESSARRLTFTPAANFTGEATFEYTISDGRGGSDTATVRVTVEAADPPRVTDLRLINRGQSITAVALVFDKDLNPATAQNAANYEIRQSGRDRQFGTRDDRLSAIRTAVYSAAADTVTLNLVKKIKVGTRFQITARDAITDLDGLKLDGNRDGQPGGNHVADGGLWRAVSYTDSDGDLVDLALASLADAGPLPPRLGPRRFSDLFHGDDSHGLLELVWWPDGDLRLLRIVTESLRADALVGRVRSANGSDGVATIDAVISMDEVLNRLPICAVNRTSRCFQVVLGAID